MESEQKREEFPSLGLMTKPLTPAPPRLKEFPGNSLSGAKWRCRVELGDIVRRKGVGALTMRDYSAQSAEGWGDTKERAYNAWKCRWKAQFEEKP